MDGVMTEHSVLPIKPNPGMPPRDPLDMPIQDLRRAPAVPKRRWWPRSVLSARLLTFGGAALLTAFGTYEMVEVVSVGGITYLEGLMTAIFAITFAWISLAATSALTGAIVSPLRHIRLAHTGNALASRTALVMPIYHEDPIRTVAALETMARGLHALGESAAFEIVVLSDSTNADAWVRETLAVDRLSDALVGIMPVWYRRRWANIAKKAGNIKDFIEHWGARYDHFIVLDADSLMAPDTLVTLVAAMEKDAALGILQTIPTLAGGRTLFARLQQFAGRIHGPVVSRGLAAWQGSDGNYWGHNAIIRTRAFAGCCGLPVLPGKKPFGGPILSHDFVEAALMRRAGWRVEMATRLEGSWEESPPSLIDTATRDRRWAQGNLQHSKVIATKGLSLASRAHLAIGIMSYLSSPLWLLLIALGFALSIQASLVRPEYFSGDVQLFPTWPHFDSERMIRLFVFTMLVLLLPKLIGLARAMAIPSLRRGCGGALRLVGSFFAEIAISALFAPIMMVIHSRQIYEILVGRDAGWSAQRRDDGGTRWTEAWQRHRWHMGCGLLMAIAAWSISPAILAWLSPTLAGLLLAVPLSWASGSVQIGDALRRACLLVTPEESDPPALHLAREATAAAMPPLPEDGIRALVSDKTMRETHYKWATSMPRLRGAPEPSYLTASEKVWDARSREEALTWLEPKERVHVAGHRAMVEHLVRLPDGNGPRPTLQEPAPEIAERQQERELRRSPAA
jgi:membrane glycosyltransferase